MTFEKVNIAIGTTIRESVRLALSAQLIVFVPFDPMQMHRQQLN
jgi:hypothetical protein